MLTVCYSAHTSCVPPEAFFPQSQTAFYYIIYILRIYIIRVCRFCPLFRFGLENGAITLIFTYSYAKCMETATFSSSKHQTYAWFTMSREVEVTGLKMTATVPEDLQISLGEITSGSDSVNLTSSTGVLTIADNAVKPPTNSDDDDPFDWSNSADISAYYSFGKLIPAGSTNGENVYFTPDAAGVGKTMKATAVSYQAADDDTALADSTVLSSTSTTYLNATAHSYSATEKTGFSNGVITGTGWTAKSAENSTGYLTASAFNATNDDGYYIDIPIWLRTSSTTSPSVYVTGYITDGTNASSTADTDGDELYKAVRVAILDENGGTAGGVIELSDQTKASPAAYPSTQVAAASSLIDSGIAASNYSLTDISALANTGSMAAGLYDKVTINKGATAIGTLTAKTSSTTSQYAVGTKFIIRVWLEGDDVNCWNANAGQDWAISLKFMTSALPASANNNGEGGNNG